MPVYSGLATSINSLHDTDGNNSLATLPALATLIAMFDIFAINERKISRIREFEADKAGGFFKQGACSFISKSCCFLFSPPEEPAERSSSLLNAIYILAATMIGADGQIEQSEIKTAEGYGKQLINSFDEVELRAMCKNVSELPKFENIVDILANAFEQKELQIIYDYLKDIANADGERSEEEKKLLLLTRKCFKLEM